MADLVQKTQSGTGLIESEKVLSEIERTFYLDGSLSECG